MLKVAPPMSSFVSFPLLGSKRRWMTAREILRAKGRVTEIRFGRGKVARLISVIARSNSKVLQSVISRMRREGGRRGKSVWTRPERLRDERWVKEEMSRKDDLSDGLHPGRLSSWIWGILEKSSSCVWQLVLKGEDEMKKME